MSLFRGALMLAALICSLHAGEKAVVFDFQPLGVDTSIARTAAVLVRDELSALGAFDIVEPQPGTQAYTPPAAAAAAKPLGAAKAVTGSLVQIGGKLVVSYRLIDVAEASVVLSDRVSMASIEELDVVAGRIARSIKDRRPFSASIEAGKTTVPERGRSLALSSFYVTTGYTFLLDKRLAYDPGTMLFTLDGAVSYETPSIMTQGLMGWRFGKHGYDEIYFDLLVHGVLSKSDITPYLGGGVGIHSYRFRPESPLTKVDYDAFAVTVSGGAILFRTQYFRITGGAKGSLAFSDDFKDGAGKSFVLPEASFCFGLTSPTIGPGGSMEMPSPCVYGCMGAFFLTGLIVALTTR